MNELENLARYLVNERRRVDLVINDGSGCEPYPTWDKATEDYKNMMLQQAASILAGDVQ